MYSSALWLHSWLRWAVLVAGAFAWVRAVRGYSGKRSWLPIDELWGFTFSILLDVQFVVGLILYIFLSPITKIGFQNLAAAMRIDTVRFFTVEHITGMLIAIGLVHMGRLKIRKATDATRKHRIALIYFGLAMLVMVAAIPWPILTSVSRPLFHP
jgi:hypothetical protein